MMTDWDNTRRARRKKPLETKRKKRVAFLRCTKCGKDWAQQIYADQSPRLICPDCGGTAIEE